MAEKAKSNKTNTKKVLNYIANALTVIICLLALLVAISAISTSKTGYNSFFGTAFFAVGSDSMDGGAFNEGDVIRVKLLKAEDKAELKVGDVITFIDRTLKASDGSNVYTTHRVVGIEDMDGHIYFRTQGDNAAVCPEPDNVLRDEDDVVGLFKSKFNGIGNALIWMQTKTGFLVCVVVPSALLLIYCFVMVIMNIINYNKHKIVLNAEAAQAEKVSELEEELRAKILAELKSKEQDEGGVSESEDTAKESVDTAKESEDTTEAEALDDSDKPQK